MCQLNHALPKSCIVSSTELFFLLDSENGCLAFGKEAVISFNKKMTVNGVDSQLMSGKEANDKYPKQLKLPDDYNCFFIKNCGMIRASHALATLQVGVST